MICAPSNAYPNNNCIDGSNLPEFKFTFYGDHTPNAAIRIYDYYTMKQEIGTRYCGEKGGVGYYNGEEMGVKNWGDVTLDQNKEYVWQATIYADVDFPTQHYPDIFVSSGKTQECPFIEATVLEFPNGELKDTQIFVTAGLNIKTPCYVYYPAEESYKKVVSYTSNGVLTINSAFNTKPETDEELVICKYKSIDGYSAISGNVVYIEPKQTINKGTHPVGIYTINNYYIKIGDNYFAVGEYYTKTGVVITNEQNNSVSGTEYQVYATYVKSPYYYFTTKPTPVISPTMEFANEVIKCEATITNSGNFPIKYYYWEIFKNNVLIDKSEDIYSGYLEYLFRGLETNTTYTGKLTIVTQDNVVTTSSAATCTIPQSSDAVSNLKAVIDSDKNAVKLTWTNSVVSPAVTGFMILRKDADNIVRYIETVQSKISTYYDYSCADNSAYTYYVIPKSTTTIYNQATVNINTKFNTWTLYYLTEIPYTKPSPTLTDTRTFWNYMYGDKQYKVSSIWKIQIDTELGDIEGNLKRDVETPYRAKPVITYGNANYKTFPLSFTLGNLTCPNYEMTGYDQLTYEKWESDVASQKSILLKDSKGNVWCGAITSNSAKIDFSIPKYMPYTISIDFTQTRDMSKTRILTS